MVFAEDDGQVAKVRSANLSGLLAIVLIDGDAPTASPVLSLDELAERGRALLAEKPDAVDRMRRSAAARTTWRR